MIRRIALGLACIGIAFAALAFTGAAASAQTTEPTIEDFTDEEGNIDFEGYTAALNAFLASQGAGSGTGGTAAGGLPRTGSDTGDLVAMGAGLILVGGTVVLWVRDRRQRVAA